MGRNRWLRLLAVLLALAMVAAACDGDDEEAAPADGEDTTTTELQRRQVEGLFIGQIWPETGPLAFLGPPQFHGVRAAIEDINAAGGVLGREVQLDRGDEAGEAARVRSAAQRLLSDGAQVIIGAASSAMTDEIIQLLNDNRIPQCSPSNTSPKFAEQENAAFYVRTVPPDNAVAPVIANRVIADGHETIAIAALNDAYGEPLGRLIQQAAEAQGATVTDLVLYDPNTENFDSVVQQLQQGNPSAVVFVSFNEGVNIIKGLLEAGMEPSAFYGADGIFAPNLPAEVDPTSEGVLDGMTVIGAAGNEEFLNRIAEATENNFIYAGQSYDCAVLLALAVEQVGNTTDGEAIVAAAIEISKDGTKCTTFEECKGLIEDGEENIDYDGASGPIELDETGDPQVVDYAIGQFQDGGTLTIVGSERVDVSEVTAPGEEDAPTTTTS